MRLAAAYKRIGVYLGIIAFTAIFLMPFLGFVHLLDSDETKYAESAREMLVTGDYLTVQIDFEPFPEKPPLFFWLQTLSMKIFGINEFAARFPNIICGFASLVLLYYLGRQLYGHRFGLLWILSYGSAILPFFFFKSGIIDPWFNLFILMGVGWFIFYLDPERLKYRMRNVVLSALFFGLAVLTKGPVALWIFLLCFVTYLSIHRFRIPGRAIHIIPFILVVTLIGGSWFLMLALNGNTEMIRDFVAYQFHSIFIESSFHDGFFGYHLVVLLLGVFPASVIAMNQIFGFGLDRWEMVKISQKAENVFVGVNCGIMDQFASGMGAKDHALFLNCDTLEFKKVPLVLEGMKIVIANTNKRRGLANSKYNERRAQCESAVEAIRTKKQIRYLSDLNLEEFNTLSHLITDEIERKRAKHVITENNRTLTAIEALNEGDIKTFGILMNQSHDSLKEDYEVTGKELDTLVDEARKIEGTLGSRMTGAGFGGCTVSIVKEDAVESFIAEVGKGYTDRTGLKADFYVAEIGDGSKEII
jgi:mevalonate kinase